MPHRNLPSVIPTGGPSAGRRAFGSDFNLVIAAIQELQDEADQPNLTIAYDFKTATPSGSGQIAFTNSSDAIVSGSGDKTTIANIVIQPTSATDTPIDDAIEIQHARANTLIVINGGVGGANAGKRLVMIGTGAVSESGSNYEIPVSYYKDDSDWTGDLPADGDDVTFQLMGQAQWTVAGRVLGDVGGSDVEANPAGAATGTLTTIEIADVVYKIAVAWANITGRPNLVENKGAWATNTAYGVGNVVTHSGELFYCIVEHTSSGTAPSATDFERIDVEAVGEVNPRHVGPAFRTFDSDGETNVLAGTFYPIKSDNSMWQAGSSTEIDAIEFHPSQFSLTQNPQLPGATPAYTDWHSLPDDMAANGGSVIVTLQRIDNSTLAPIAGKVAYIQSDAVSKNSDSNYVLSELTHLIGFDNTDGAGNDWQVVMVFAPPSGADAIIGVIAKSHLPSDTVYAEQLAGHETDRFASYNNAFVQNSYRAGDWVLTSDSAGPPTQANQVRQPDIATGSGLFCIGRLRTDADPNELQWAAVPAATDMVSGDVWYASIDADKGPHLKITLTSNGALVGTGDAAYVWATASWVETGSIADVQDFGDYFRLGREEPSTLQVELPYQDILGAPWLELSGTELTDGDLSLDDEVVLSDGDVVPLSETYEFHDEHHVGLFTITGLRYVTTNAPATGGDINFNVNALDSTKGIVSYKYVDAAARATMRNKIIVGRPFEIRLSSAVWIKGVVDSTPADLFGRLSFNLNSVTTEGTATNEHAASVIVISKIPADNQIVPGAKTWEDVNLAGKGGLAGRVWAYLSSATNATWRRMLDVLKQDADTDEKRADYQAALSPGNVADRSLTNANATLTARQAAYDSVEFTGTLTGNVVVTLPDEADPACGCSRIPRRARSR